jgi:hypothetical protein
LTHIITVVSDVRIVIIELIAVVDILIIVAWFVRTKIILISLTVSIGITMIIIIIIIVITVIIVVVVVPVARNVLL